MEHIEIFEDELNLRDIIEQNNSIAINVPYKIAKGDSVASYASKLRESFENVSSSGEEARNADFSKVLARLAKASKSKKIDKQVDLLYGDAILVSAGINLNDDIFLPSEIWSARDTPVSKPSNWGHSKKEIVGHITDSWVVNNSTGKIIKKDDELTDQIDIYISFVVYKAIFPEYASKIEESGPTGELCVSMECMFHGFDYGFVDDDDSLTVVARTKDTAFLTKHLRVYGGTGEYDGKKIGRVLKNIVFIGKGFVDEPANPKSLITSVANINYSKMENKMNQEEKIAELTSKLAVAEKRIAEFEHADKNAELAKVVAERDELKTELDSVKSEIEKVKAEIVAKEEEIKSLSEASEKVSKELEEAKNSLNEIGKDAVAEERLEKLVEAGFAPKEDTKEQIRDMSDAEFEKMFKFVSDAIVSKGEQEEVDNTVTQAEKDAKEAAERALNNVEPEDDANASVDDTQPEVSGAQVLAKIFGK
ncbi:MAG: hypothetical protein WC967_12675 [Balneolaceae bacterium]